MKAIMIIIVAACGHMGSGGSGCGTDIEYIPFQDVELCERAVGKLFQDTGRDAWQPKREIQCVENTRDPV